MAARHNVTTATIMLQLLRACIMYVSTTCKLIYNMFLQQPRFCIEKACFKKINKVQTRKYKKPYHKCQ